MTRYATRLLPAFTFVAHLSAYSQILAENSSSFFLFALYCMAPPSAARDSLYVA
jgi:hypothetical protein